MIVVADSGSSKTAWTLIDSDGETQITTTSGLNPMHTSHEDFIRILRESDLSFWPTSEVTYVYYYGAGIADLTMQNVVCDYLSHVFNSAKISAGSDLLGAARAAFGNKKGIIGILGTGSNSGYYDGKKILSTIPPLGYILGDEGSGTALGKAFVQHFLRNQLPDVITNKFKQFYADYDRLLTSIYTPKVSAKILASMVPFLLEHKTEPAIKNILEAEFQRYFQLFVSYDRSMPIVLVGSVAYYFKEEIGNIAQNEGLVIANIIQSPIEGLTQYHIRKQI